MLHNVELITILYTTVINDWNPWFISMFGVLNFQVIYLKLLIIRRNDTEKFFELQSSLNSCSFETFMTNIAGNSAWVKEPGLGLIFGSRSK